MIQKQINMKIYQFDDSEPFKVSDEKSECENVLSDTDMMDDTKLS